jgi:hypothetical protein
MIFLFILCISSLGSMFVSSSSKAFNRLPENCAATQASQVSSAGASGIPEKQPRWVYESSGTVNLVDISSDGLYACMGTEQGYVYLFNTTSRTVLGNVHVGESIRALDISYYGEYLAAAAGNLLKVYRINDGTLEYLWNFTNNPGVYQGGIHSLAFSSNGSVLAVGTWCYGYGSGSNFAYAYVHLFETVTGAKLWSHTITPTQGGWVTDYVSVDISSDGEYIVAGSTWQPKVYLFNWTTSTPIYSPFPTSSAVNSVNFNGQSYVIGCNVVHYFEVGLSGPKWSAPLSSNVISVSLSANGKKLAAATKNSFALLADNGTELGDWNFPVEDSSSLVSISANGEYSIAKSGAYLFFFVNNVDADPSTPSQDPSWSYNTETTIHSISISAEGKHVATGSGAYLYLHDDDFNPDIIPTEIHFSETFPIEGEIVIIYAKIDNVGNLRSETQHVRIFDNGILISVIEVGSISEQSSTIVSIDEYISPPGLHQVEVEVDCYDSIYESNETNNSLTQEIEVESLSFTDTGANPIVTLFSQTVNCLSLSGNGYYLVTGTKDNYVSLFYRNATGPVWSFTASGPVSKIAISRDGSYIAASTGNILYVFSRLRNVPLWNFTNNPGAYQGGIHSLAFSSNGSALAAGTWCYGYGSYSTVIYSYVHLFDTITGTTQWSYTVTASTGDWTTDYVSVDISSDGEYIVAGSTWQPKVYLFNKHAATPVFTPFPADSGVNSVSMSAGGQYYVAGASSVYYFSKAAPAPQWLIPFHSSVTSVSISDDGAYLTATNQTHLFLFKNNQTELWNYNLPQQVRAQISANGDHIAAQSSYHAFLFSKSDGYLWAYPTQSQSISVSISSDGRYSAYTSENKTVFFDVHHKADLTPTNIFISNPQPNEGDTIKIDATISNIGSFKSYYVPIQLFDNDTLAGSAEIDPLSPGASMSVSINYICQANQRSLRIHVNSWLTQTYESNYSNNDITSSLYVNARPANVTLSKPTTMNSTSMELAWTQNLDADFAKYEIYASTHVGELGVLKETIVPQTTTRFVVTGLDASTTYYFTVRVVDSGNAFSNSNQNFGTTLPSTVVLSNPTNPRTTSLDVSWTENVDNNFASYKIYYSTSMGDVGSLLATINNQSKTTYTATGLKASTEYYFTVYVTNVQGLSSVASNKARGVTLPTPVTLNNPTSMTLSSMTLTWTRNTDSNFQKYEIYRSANATTLGELIASKTEQSATSYTASGLNSSRTYYFVVKVVGLDSLASLSNQVYGTTLGPGWDFAISISPTSQIAMRGGSTSYTIAITGFGEKSIGKSVTLSVSGLPGGVTHQFSSTSVATNQTSTLTVTVASFAEEDTYKLTIVATSGELTKSDTVDLVVKSEEIDYSRWVYALSGIAITAAVAAAVLLKKRKHK